MSICLSSIPYMITYAAFCTQSATPMSKLESCETLFAGTTMLGRNATAHQAVEMDLDELIRATRLIEYIFDQDQSKILFPNILAWLPFG